MLGWVLAAVCVGGAGGGADPGPEARASWTWDGGDEERASLAAAVNAARAAATERPVAFEYSEGYRIRRKVHKYASAATLPLFVAQFVVGQKLYDGNASDATRSAHGALAAGTGALFAVNTVTGVWNLSEGRKDPSHRTRRRVHGILMIAADAGFLATGLIAPEGDDERRSGRPPSGRSAHRAVALTSMGIATASYLIMLLGD